MSEKVTALSALAGLAHLNEQAPPPDKRYTLRFGSARTGRVFGTLPAFSGSGDSGLNGDGSVNIGVGPGQSVDLYRRVPPGYTMWLLEWRDGSVRRLVDGGVLWNDDADASLSLGGAGFLSLLHKRKLIPNVAADQIATAADLTYASLDHGSIMRAVVNQALTMPNGDLPIALEASRAGTRQQTYHGYDLGYVAARLLEIAGQSPVTEFTLDPSYTDDTHQFATFNLVTGTEADPQLSNTVPHRLNGATPGQLVLKRVKASRSATDMGTDAYAGGGDQGTSRTIRAASDTTLTDAGWPRMDIDDQSDATDAATVQGYADGLLARSRFPLRGVTCVVDAAWWWANGSKGDQVHVTTNHPVMGPLDFTSRVLRVGWDITSPDVALTLSDTLAEGGV